MSKKKHRVNDFRSEQVKCIFYLILQTNSKYRTFEYRKVMMKPMLRFSICAISIIVLSIAGSLLAARPPAPKISIASIGTDVYSHLTSGEGLAEAPNNPIFDIKGKALVILYGTRSGDWNRNREYHSRPGLFDFALSNKDLNFWLRWANGRKDNIDFVVEREGENTVFLVTDVRDEYIGKYGNGTDRYKVKAKISVIYWPSNTFVGNATVEAVPPDRISYGGNIGSIKPSAVFGDVNRAIAYWINSLPRT